MTERTARHDRDQSALPSSGESTSNGTAENRSVRPLRQLMMDADLDWPRNRRPPPVPDRSFAVGEWRYAAGTVVKVCRAGLHLAFPETSSICSSPFIEIVLISLASRSTAFMSTIRMRLLSKVRK